MTILTALWKGRDIYYAKLAKDHIIWHNVGQTMMSAIAFDIVAFLIIHNII